VRDAPLRDEVPSPILGDKTIVESAFSFNQEPTQESSTPIEPASYLALLLIKYATGQELSF
jgi:hypothetical protein